MIKGIFRIGLGVIKKCQFYFTTNFIKYVQTKVYITHTRSVSGHNLLLFSRLPGDSQSLTLLDFGTTSLLHAYWLIDTDEINFLGTEIWWRMTRQTFVDAR